MKKFLLTSLAVFAFAISASAINWVVTVSTQNRVTFKDCKSREVIGEYIEPGRALTFYIVADTPREAENQALNQCGGACSDGYARCVQEGVYYKGHLCDKYVETVPYDANAEVNTKSTY